MNNQAPEAGKNGVAENPNRILSFIAYLIVLIGPLLVLLFGRKNKFSLYHACQSLGLLFIAVAVPLLWLVIGWLFAFISVQAPILYLVPIALLLLVPVVQRRNKAVRYAERWSWLNIGLTLAVAVILIYGCYLVLNWLAPIVLPLAGPLLLYSGFSIVMAAYAALVVAWVVGMINALRAQWKPVPVFGGWGERLYARFAGGQP